MMDKRSLLLLLLLFTCIKVNTAVLSQDFHFKDDSDINSKNDTDVNTFDNRTKTTGDNHVYSANIPKSSINVNTFDNWTSIINKNQLQWLHNQNYRGKEIKVGIIDNGIDFSHDAFENVTYNERSFVKNIDSQSTETHGTPVAGVMIGYSPANIIGTSPDISIISAEMGSNTEDTQLIGNFTAAIQWLAYQNVSIINTSFGGIENWTSFIKIAEENNIIIVGSVGNDGGDYPPSGPASELYGIGVGAINTYDKVAYFSSRGPTYNYIQKPDIVSHGSLQSINVISGTGIYTGTSFSSPLIAGGIASVLSGLKMMNISWTVGGVKSALINSAIELSGDYKGQGAGIVNFTRMFQILSTGNSGTIIGADLIDEYTNLPIALEERLPIQVIGSGDLTINITGNISSLLSVDKITDYTSLPIMVNTSTGKYNGKISLYSDGVIMYTVNISMHIIGKFMGRVGFDYYHSNSYINGEETLLNSNLFAKELRSNGYRPVYITNKFTEDLLSEITLLIMKDISIIPSAEELDILMNYTMNGGHILYASDIKQIDNFMIQYGININVDDILLIKTLELQNTSSYAQNTKYISHRGFEFLGGKSIIKNNRGMVVNDTFNGRVFFSSSLLFLDDLQFSIDMVNWLIADIYYSYYNLSINNGVIEMSYTGFENDVAYIIRYDYDETYDDRTQIIIKNNITSHISYNMSDGLFDILIQNNNSYLQIEYTDNNNLISDNIPPEFQLQSAYDLLLNKTAGQSSITVIVKYYDNYKINKTDFIVIADDTQISYLIADNYVEFTVYDYLFNSDVLSIIFYGSDISGNNKTIYFDIIINKIKTTPVSIIQGEQTVKKFDEIKYVRSELDYINRMRWIILFISILILIAIVGGKIQ